MKQTRGSRRAARSGVSSVRVRKVKGKKGVVREQYDLIVNIDLVMSSSGKYVDILTESDACFQVLHNTFNRCRFPVALGF